MVRFHNAGRNDQLGGLFYRHVQYDDFGLGHEQQEPGRGVGRGGQKHAHHFGIRVRGDFAFCLRGDEHHGPDTLSRVLDQSHLLEAGLVIGCHRFEDLLQRAVNTADDRHARDDAVAQINDGTAEQIFRENAQHQQGHEHNQKAQGRGW